MTYALIGHIDPSAQGIGFLIPVFSKTGSNELFVQVLSKDGSLRGFQILEGYDGPVDYTDQTPVGDAEESFWAFSFSEDDRIVGRGSDGKVLLEDRLDSRFFGTRPLLAVEVAEFLQLPYRRVEWAEQAMESLRGLGVGIPEAWRDLSLLTPDLRAMLAEQDADISLATRRIVASTNDDTVHVRGISGPETKRIDSAIRKAVLKILRRLDPLYASTSPRWRVHIAWEQQRHRRRKNDALIYLTDKRDSELKAHLALPGDLDLEVYAPDESEEFDHALWDESTMAFVVVRGGHQSAQAQIASFPPGRVIGIHVGTSSQTAGHHQYDLLSEADVTLVSTQAGGFPGLRTSYRTIARTVRQIIAAMLDYGNNKPGKWAFYRATGTGPDREGDAWSALYDKVRSKHPHMTAITLCGPSAARSLPPHEDRRAAWVREVLFPSTRNRHGILRGGRYGGSGFEVAALLQEGSESRTDNSDESAIEALFSARGWEVVGATRIFQAKELEVAGPDHTFRVRLSPEPLNERHAPTFPQLHDLALDRIDTLAIVPNVNIKQLIQRLQIYGEFAVSIRDLCSSDGRAGLYSLLGSQLRRFAVVNASQYHTLFMGLLIGIAFKRSDVRIGSAGVLEELIYRRNFSKFVNLHWARTRRVENVILTEVTAMPNSLHPDIVTYAKLPTFQLAIHSNGVSVFNK